MDPIRIPTETVRKWHDLAERQRAHLVSLYRSGRWRLHYSEPAFRDQLQHAGESVEAWQKVIDRGEVP